MYILSVPVIPTGLSGDMVNPSLGGIIGTIIILLFFIGLIIYRQTKKNQKYWWVISIIESDSIGGEGPDDESYPIQRKKIFKLSGAKNEETYKKIVSEISSQTELCNRRIDSVWCLGPKGNENKDFAGILYLYIKKEFKLK